MGRGVVGVAGEATPARTSAKAGETSPGSREVSARVGSASLKAGRVSARSAKVPLDVSEAEGCVAGVAGGVGSSRAARSCEGMDGTYGEGLLPVRWDGCLRRVESLLGVLGGGVGGREYVRDGVVGSSSDGVRVRTVAVRAESRVGSVAYLLTGLVAVFVGSP